MKDEKPTYAVRIRPAAWEELHDISDRVLRLADLSLIAQWHGALRFILADLSVSPWSYAPCRASRLLRTEVRAVLHDVGPPTAIHRILFTIKEADAEAPFVYIISVRPIESGTRARAEEDHAEEAAIVRARQADRVAGDEGMFLEDYRAEVMAKREERGGQQKVEIAA